MTLNKVDMRLVLNEEQCARVEQINRRVGKIKLYKIARIVAKVAEAQGREISIAENGFRSLYEPSMLDKPMEKFLAPKLFRPDHRRLDTAVQRVRKQLKGMGEVAPVSFEDAYSWLLQSKENNFAGLPTMGKKGEDLGALARAKACARGKCPPPAVIGHRGKNEEVARPVWMFPFEWHIIEAAYFIPLQEQFKRNVRMYAASNAVARRAVINEVAASGAYNSKIAMDYSGFDGSIGTQLIGIAFGLLSEHLAMSEEQRKLWSRVATYFATCPFVDQHGNVVTGRRGGVPSGSMFTQIVDSIVNAIAIEYIFVEYRKKHYYVYGDDSLLFLTLSVDEAKEVMETVKRRAGELALSVNLKKTHVCAPCEPTSFLGHYDLHPGRPADEVLARLIFPERPTACDAASLQSRVISYMAESDEVISLLMPVYLALRIYAREGKVTDTDIQQCARNGSWQFHHLGGVQTNADRKSVV